MRHLWICVTASALASPLGVAEARQQPPNAERVRAALELPAVVDSVRRHGGIPEHDVRGVLDEARKRRVPAAETHDILQQSDAAIREHGPVNNFGAFVQGRLAAGLRGRALAQAIRAEHTRRGIGKGKLVGSTKGTPVNAKGAANRTNGKAASPAAKRPTAASSQKQKARDTGNAAKTSTATKSTTKGATKSTKTTTKTPTKTKGRP